jgi:hypothetical protein
MGKRTDQPAEIIAWLRTPEGEQWSDQRLRSGLAYWGDGAFGDVIPDSWGESAAARWPEPLPFCELDGVDFDGG